MGLEIVSACQQASRVTRRVFVPSRSYIAVTQVGVGIRVGACRVRDVNVETTTECRSMTIISVYGIDKSFHVELKWCQSIIIFKREYETPGGVCVRTTGI